MKHRSGSKGKEEQVIMPGILTEDQIVKGYLKRIASKGGSAGTEAQRRARLANVDKALRSRGIVRKDKEK